MTHDASSNTQRVVLQVKTLTGKLISITVAPSERVDDIKRKVQDTEGIPPCEQRLLFAGKQLVDDRLVSEYSIKPEAMLLLVPVLSMEFERTKTTLDDDASSCEFYSQRATEDFIKYMPHDCARDPTDAADTSEFDSDDEERYSIASADSSNIPPHEYPAAGSGDDDDDEADDDDEEEDEEDDGHDSFVDETGLRAGDIELVCLHTNASRGSAARALREHAGDIVRAIMQLID